MSIPLVQEATKDAINTSIIAIKRNIERINMLLGLVDSGSPDLSGLATKQELEDAITQVETDLAPVDEVTSGNMQSVTSNAVAESISYSETERFTGKYFGNKKVYRCAVNGVLTGQLTTIQNIQHLLNVTGYIINNGNMLMANTYQSTTTFSFIYLNGNTIYAQFPQGMANSNCYINLEYTKTTD